jgi:hypothetical protein
MSHTRNQAGPHRPIPAEPIPPGQLWPIALLHSRLGWGARSRAAAIRAGLKVHRWGKYAYVATDNLMAFLTASGQTNAAAGPRREAGQGGQGDE